ncbi:MAG: ABC transporter permease subunit [Clostridia bacterium]|nr:ABC transporter permease subunit [Clostridia bacterium]
MIKAYFSKRKFNIILSLSAFALMWLIWIIAYYGVQNDYVIPSISDTAKSFGKCLISVNFWLAFVNTVLRTAFSFVISFVLSVALVAIGAVCKPFNSFIKPFMGVLRTLPTLAIILILLFWTNPKVAPLIVTILVLFPMIYSQLNAAVSGIDEGIIEMAEVYKISNREKLTKIYLPLISPYVLSQTGANISLGIKVMISAEVLAGTYKSFGGLMQNARFYVDMPRLAALTIIAVLIGLLIDLCFSLIERATFKWSKKQ